MYWIAHRGNLYGPNPSRENHPDYIQEALHQGYDVEIDVWYKNGTWWLGHDEPQYPTTLSFLQTPRLWIHAKSLEALTELCTYKDTLHFFSHDGDPVVLTSQAIPWVFPGKPLNHRCVAVMPERAKESYKESQLKECYGICSDYIADYFKYYQ